MADNPDIYVQQIGAGAPLRLTTDPGNDYSPELVAGRPLDRVSPADRTDALGTNCGWFRRSAAPSASWPKSTPATFCGR